MLVIAVPAWVAATNAYVVAEESGGQALVVDAPPEPEAIGAVLIQHDLTLAGVLLTHGHIDHTGGSGELARATGASVYVHPDDDFLTLHPLDQLRAMFGMTPPGEYDMPERVESLTDGDHIQLAGFDLEVRHTPGHTPEHITFLVTDRAVADEPMGAVTGDFVFVGDVGRPDLLERDQRGPDSTRGQADQIRDTLRCPEWI